MVDTRFMIFLMLLTSAEVTVTKILHSSGVEAWITSDGRAYFVRLQEIRHSEDGASELSEEESGGVSIPVLLFPLNLIYSGPGFYSNPNQWNIQTIN